MKTYDHMLYCSYVLSGTKGTFISHVSALPLVHIIYDLIICYLKFALIYLLGPFEDGV
jgi:hypothetical protein